MARPARGFMLLPAISLLAACAGEPADSPTGPAAVLPDAALLPDAGPPSDATPLPDDGPSDLAIPTDAGPPGDLPGAAELGPGEDASEDAGAAPPGPLLNEIQCQGPDWVELFNPAAQPVELAGWMLGEAAQAAGAVYRFPSGTRLPPGGLQVVRRAGGGEPGLPFGLACGDDTLRLFRPDGAVADLAVLPRLPAERSWGRVPDGTGAWRIIEPTPGGTNRAADEEDPSDAVFDVEAIHEVALELPAADWDDVRDNPQAKTWHRASFRWDDETVADVGVRAFGWGSLRPGKPPLKIAFDRYVEDQGWRGLRELKLDDSSQDTSFLAERIESAALRRAGLPAARTGWARVTVNGEPAGFFVVLEAVDRVFVTRWFGTGDGNLYGTVQGTAWQGLNPMDAPLAFFDPQTGEPTDGSDLVEIARVVAEGSDEELRAALDLDGFTRASVARSVLGSLDSFSADGSNFYLYDDGRVWHHISWDMDVDLGGSGYVDLFDRSRAMDLRAPWASSPWSVAPDGHQYTDAVLLRHLAMGVDLDAIVRELLDGPLDWATMDREIASAAALIRDEVQDDTLGYGPGFEQWAIEKRLWLHTRLTDLAGREVAACPPPPAGVLRAAGLDPVGSVGWGELLVDRSTLGPGFMVGGEHHCSGIFAHAPSEVTLTLPPGATRLHGSVGIQDYHGTCGDGVRFRVEQEGASLWESEPVRVLQLAVDMGELPVRPGTLRLVTDPLGDIYCDTAVWLDLELR